MDATGTIERHRRAHGQRGSNRGDRRGGTEATIVGYEAAVAFVSPSFGNETSVAFVPSAVGHEATVAFVPSSIDLEAALAVIPSPVGVVDAWRKHSGESTTSATTA